MRMPNSNKYAVWDDGRSYLLFSFLDELLRSAGQVLVALAAPGGLCGFSGPDCQGRGRGRSIACQTSTAIDGAVYPCRKLPLHYILSRRHLSKAVSNRAQKTKEQAYDCTWLVDRSLILLHLFGHLQTNLAKMHIDDWINATWKAEMLHVFELCVSVFWLFFPPLSQNSRWCGIATRGYERSKNQFWPFEPVACQRTIMFANSQCDNAAPAH